jgi:translation elongation factor EF-G
MPFNYTHEEKSGGAGQFAKVIGYIEPLPDNEDGGPSEFFNKVVGGHISKNFIPACEKGFADGLVHGFLIDQPVVRLRYVLEDGQMHHEYHVSQGGDMSDADLAAEGADHFLGYHASIVEANGIDTAAETLIYLVWQIS